MSMVLDGTMLENFIEEYPNHQNKSTEDMVW